jgi:hypothetical protein
MTTTSMNWTSPSGVKIQMLTGQSNFLEWKSQMTAYFMMEGFDGILDGTDYPPVRPGEKLEISTLVVQEYLQKKKAHEDRLVTARRTLFASMDVKNRIQFKEQSNDAHLLWKSVCQHYNRSSYARFCSAITRVPNLRLADCASIEDFNQRFLEARSEMATMVTLILPQAVKDDLMNSTKTSGTQEVPIVSPEQIEGHILEAFTVPAYLQQIAEQFEYLAIKTRSEETDPTKVDLSTVMAQVVEADAERQTSAAYTSRTQQHKKAKANKEQKKREKCPTCKKTGHVEEDCWFKNPGKAPKTWQGRHNKQEESGKAAKAKVKEEEPEWESEFGAIAVAPQIDEFGFCSSIQIDGDTEEPHHYELACNAMLDGEWAVDSGATRHMTGNKDLLTNLRPIAGVTVKTADNTLIATHEGDYRLRINRQQEKPAVLRLEKVLYIPRFRVNLFSVRRARDKGLIFRPDLDALTTGDGSIVTKLPTSQNLWILPTSDQALISVDTTSWHQRLGHPSNRYLRKL